ncbi:MAG: MFS transporter, partial [Halobacterium sp.]
MARLSPVTKYYLYVATQAAWFTTPIWNVFLLAKGLSYTELGVLNSTWWAATVFGEVPTGYVADRIGRRASLLLGALTHVVCVLVFGLLNTFWPILGVYTVWGVGRTFRSGAESAWLYDTLADRMDEDRFAFVKGRGTSVSLAVAGASALVGGWLYGLDPYYPFAAAGAVTGVGAAVAATIPASETYEATDPLTPREALGVVRDAADQPALRWFVPATVALVALGWTVGVFIQPVSADLLRGAGVAEGRVPTLLGVLYAGFTAVSAVVTYKSGAIRERVGIERWTRLAPVGLGVVYAASFLFPLLAVPAFFARRAVLSATGVFRDAYVNERAETAGRATVLSAVAMLLGLARIPARVGVGVVADATAPLAAVGLVGVLL